MRVTTLILSSTMLPILLAGCVHLPIGNPVVGVRDSNPAGLENLPRNVEISGSCLELKEGSTRNCADFARRVEELLTKGRRYSAGQLVERFPDLSRGCLANRAQSGPGSAYGACNPQCRAFVQAVYNKHISPSGSDIYDSIRQYLDYGEHQRLAKHESGWIEGWKQGALLAGGLAVPFHPVRFSTRLESAMGLIPDPNLWEKISALRPAKTDWSEALRSKLQEHWTHHGLPELSKSSVPLEALVWFSIGHWHMDRDEAKAAVTAFQRSGSAGGSANWDDFTQLYQAKSLMQLGQGAVAITILTRIASQSDSPWQRSALATIGGCKLAEGHAQQTLAFLSKALDASSDDFTGRADAEADLGLALLSVGHEAKGLAQLQSAREKFARIGKRDSLIQSLDNEIRYLEETRQQDRARVRREERDRWEAS